MTDPAPRPRVLVAAIPTHVGVGPIMYAVEHDASVVREMLRSNPQGCTDHEQARMAVDPDTDPGQQRLTLVHEWLHGMLQVSGAGQLLDEAADEELEERLVTVLAPWLLMGIATNQEMMAWLSQL